MIHLLRGLLMFCLGIPSTAFAETKQISDDFFSDIERAQADSYALRSALGRIDALESNQTSKKLSWTPTLEASIGRTQDRIDQRPFVDQDYAALTARWNLFQGGGDLFRYRAARTQLESQTNSHLSQSLQLESQAARLIFKNIQIEEKIKTQQKLTDLKKESLKIINDRYLAGQIPRQEVTKSEVDLAQQQSRFRATLLEKSQNSSALEGLGLNALKTKTWPLDSRMPLQITTADEQDPPGDRWSTNPQLKALELTMKSEEYLWQATRSQFSPRLDFTSSMTQVPWRKEPSQTQTSLGLVLTIPIWSQWETRSQISQQHANYLSAKNDLSQLERDLKAQVSSLSLQLQIVREDLDAVAQNLIKNQNLYQDMIRAFKLGRLSTNELFIEQTRLIDSETALSSAQQQFHETWVQSCHLRGISLRQCSQR